MKQQFTKYITGKVKQINIKNQTYYFSNDQIELKAFDASLLKVDKKDYKQIDVYYIGYITFKEIANCNNINSINPLYLMINEMTGHFEEKNENKYLVLDDVDENKEVSKKYEEVWEGAKKEIETINGGKKVEYGKDLKKIISEGIDVKQVHQKNVNFVTIGFLKTLDSNLKNMFAIDVMIY